MAETIKKGALRKYIFRFFIIRYNPSIHYSYDDFFLLHMCSIIARWCGKRVEHYNMILEENKHKAFG